MIEKKFKTYVIIVETVLICLLLGALYIIGGR